MLGRFPGLKAFNEVRSSWGVPSKYQFHKSGWMIFQFETEAAREKVLADGPYSTFGTPWMLKKMPLFFQFEEECFTSVPTWVKLPNLPLQLFGEEALSVLGSFIGKPIQTDHFTREMNKPDYARLLVEVDATKPLTRGITFKVPNGKVIQQEVVYEHEPQICSKCHTLGHDQENFKGPQQYQARGRSKSRPKCDVPPREVHISMENHEVGTNAVVPSKAVVKSNVSPRVVDNPVENDDLSRCAAKSDDNPQDLEVQKNKGKQQVSPLPLDPTLRRKIYKMCANVSNSVKGLQVVEDTHVTDPYPEEMPSEEVQKRFAEVCKRDLDEEVKHKGKKEKKKEKKMNWKLEEFKANFQDLPPQEWPPLEGRKSRVEDDAHSSSIKPRKRSKSACPKKKKG